MSRHNKTAAPAAAIKSEQGGAAEGILARLRLFAVVRRATIRKQRKHNLRYERNNHIGRAHNTRADKYVL